jgi:hypothetical protein
MRSLYRHHLHHVCGWATSHSPDKREPCARRRRTFRRLTMLELLGMRESHSTDRSPGSMYLGPGLTEDGIVAGGARGVGALCPEEREHESW